MFHVTIKHRDVNLKKWEVIAILSAVKGHPLGEDINFMATMATMYSIFRHTQISRGWLYIPLCRVP